MSALAETDKSGIGAFQFRFSALNPKCPPLLLKKVHVIAWSHCLGVVVGFRIEDRKPGLFGGGQGGPFRVSELSGFGGKNIGERIARRGAGARRPLQRVIESKVEEKLQSYPTIFGGGRGVKLSLVVTEFLLFH